MQAREGLSIVFRILGSGPKFQRCLPLGTKAPGEGICQSLGKILTGANNVPPVGGSPVAPRCPPTTPCPTHTITHFSGTWAEWELGRAPLSGRVENSWWGAFWLLEAARFGDLQLIWDLEPAHLLRGGRELCVLSVTGRAQGWGRGHKAAGKGSAVLVAWLGSEFALWPWEKFTVQGLGFPEHNVNGFSEQSLGNKAWLICYLYLPSSTPGIQVHGDGRRLDFWVVNTQCYI